MVLRTRVSLIVGRMYWVQKALAVYGYSERECITASVMQAWLALVIAANKRKVEGRCIVSSEA